MINSFKKSIVSKNILLFVLIFIGLAACSSTRSSIYKNEFIPPPIEYQRILKLNFENQNYHPLGKVPIKVNFRAGTILNQPALATKNDGSFEIISKPLMMVKESSQKNGDLFIDYKTELTIILWPGENKETSLKYEDVQSYAYYQDPLYHGQNRFPKKEAEFIHIMITDQ